MDKETLSNYGWIVILVLVLAVMIALATPFGLFITDAIKSTTQGLFDVNQNALDIAGIVMPDQKFEEAGIENDGNVIPDGGIYYVGVTSNKPGDYTGYTAKYEVGDTLPEVVNEGDVYVYGNYEYRYKKCYLMMNWSRYNADGWGVYCINNIADPGPILKEVNKNPVINMVYAFAGCPELVVAPIIPDTITDIYYAFSGCSKMNTYAGSTDANGDFSNYKLPENIKDISYAFRTCTSMTVAPFIPEKVTSVQYAFYSPPNNPPLTGKLYVPCHIADSAVNNMYYHGSSSTVELVRYCISSCTGCANCHSNCGH